MGNEKETLHEKRKVEHLEIFAELEFPVQNGFNRITLTPMLFPEGSVSDRDTTCTLFGKRFSFPLLVDAITGGFPAGDSINLIMGSIARKYQLPMAVGSQSIALRFPERAKGFRQLRKEFPDVFLIGNLGIGETIESVNRAVEMLQANAIQLHVNPVQELAMTEGDRDFRGWLENLEKIVRQSPVPVILKGVGAGMDEAGIRSALSCGVTTLDLGGFGGTDFPRIENARRKQGEKTFEAWGIDTYTSLQTALKLKNKNLQIIASGGMGNPMDGLKAICGGADFIGVSGALLRAVMDGGKSGGEYWIEKYMEDFKKAMLLIGKKEVLNGPKVSECR